MNAATFAAAVLLLLAVGGTIAFFLIREPLDTRPANSAVPSAVVPVPERPPLNINGVVLLDGPEIDPTDVIHLIRARVVEMNPGARVGLLGITAQHARLGKVNLDDPEAYVTYQYLVTSRDPRADKPKSAQRVEFMLRASDPALNTSEEEVNAKTSPDPLCVWSAAWRAAVASGLSGKDRTEVSYGFDEEAGDAVWTFSVADRPESLRVIDGQTCAIKASKAPKN